MNELYERFQQSQRKVRSYEKMFEMNTRCVPPVSRRLVVLMMSGSHSERLASALARITNNFTVCYACTGKGPSDPGSLVNGTSVLGFAAADSVALFLLQLSVECVRCLDRVMFCQYMCSDPQSLITRTLDLLHQENDVVLKVQASPGSLEQSLSDLLEEAAANNGMNIELTPSEAKFSHLLQVVVNPYTTHIHYGLNTRAFAVHECLTRPSLLRGLESRHHVSGSSSVPCRAYFKLSEVVDTIFPSLVAAGGINYTAGLMAGLALGDGLAVDVGASPGGWSLKLAHMGYKRVLAVDPGHLDESVMREGCIEHLPYVVQSGEVSRALEEVVYKEKLRLRMLVCDVNFEPQEAARVISEHCLPFLEGIDQATSTTPSFVILTFKMLKHPQPRHIQAAEISCRSIFEEAHRKASESSAGQTGHWRFTTLHLSANSTNERTFIARLH